MFETRWRWVIFPIVNRVLITYIPINRPDMTEIGYYWKWREIASYLTEEICLRELRSVCAYAHYILFEESKGTNSLSIINLTDPFGMAKTKLCFRDLFTLKTSKYTFQGDNSAVFNIAFLPPSGQLFQKRLCSSWSKFFCFTDVKRVAPLTKNGAKCRGYLEIISLPVCVLFFFLYIFSSN